MKRVPRWALRAGQGALLVLIGWGIWQTLAPDIAELDWQDVRDMSPRPAPLILSTLMLAAVNVAHAFLWRRIMSDLAVGRPAARETVRIWFLASLGRYLPGKLWQLAGVAMLARRAGLPGAFAMACAVLGQLTFVVTGFLLLALLLPEWGRGEIAFITAALLLAVIVVPWALLTTSAGKGTRDALRARFEGRMAERIDATFELADRIRVQDAVTWLVDYGVTWIVVGLAFSIFVGAFVPVAGGVRHLAGSIAASYLAGYVTFVPAGLGVRETALWGLLHQLPEISVAGALAIAVMARLWFTVAEMLPLAVLPLFRARGGRA